MNLPLVSIIIPTYNRKNLIQGAIKSALNQSYKNIEIIVVEDGSNCGIKTYIENLDDKKVIYVNHDNNCGLSVARNTGMNLAKGEYIAFLDDDDRWLHKKIEYQVKVAFKSKKKCEMIYCYNVDYNNSLTYKNLRVHARGEMAKFIFNGHLLPSSSMLIKIKSLISIGGHSENLKSCIDHDIWMKMAIHGFKMDLVEQGLVYSVDFDRERMVNKFDERLFGINQFFNKWKPKVIKDRGLVSWMKIEIKYHLQTSYGIVNLYRKNYISELEAMNFLNDLFNIETKKYFWYDLLIAKFALRYGTKLFHLVPFNSVRIDTLLMEIIDHFHKKGSLFNK